MTIIRQHLTLSFVFLLILFLGCTKAVNNNSIGPVPPNPPVNDLPVDSAAVIYLSAGYKNDLFALNPADGSIIWSVKVKGTYTTSAAYSNGTIMVKAYDNTPLEYISAFGTDGKLKWTFQMPGNLENPGHTPLIASEGVVYAQDREHMYAINVSDGSVKWTFTKNTQTGLSSGTFILKNHVLYVNCYASVLYALEEQTGNMLWAVDYGNPSNAPFIADDSLFLADGGEIQIRDSHTGALKKNMTSFATAGPINIKYGRIFSFDGKSTDTATFSQAYPFFTFVQRGLPEGSSYPIVADSMVIMPYGVYDAFTGELVCMPPSLTDPGSSGAYLCGATYLNHILYYTTSERVAYDPYLGGHYYSDIYAYDVRNKALLWQKTIENTDIYNVEPCIVTKSGMVYRGIYNF